MDTPTTTTENSGSRATTTVTQVSGFIRAAQLVAKCIWVSINLSVCIVVHTIFLAVLTEVVGHNLPYLTLGASGLMLGVGVYYVRPPTIKNWLVTTVPRLWQDSQEYERMFVQYSGAVDVVIWMIWSTALNVAVLECLNAGFYILWREQTLLKFLFDVQFGLAVTILKVVSW